MESSPHPDRTAVPYSELEAIFTVEETVPGSKLDRLLRLEQTKVILELLTTNLLRSRTVPPPSDEQLCE
jgi:hypothetical protein